MNPAPQHDDWLDDVERRRLSAEEAARLRRELAGRPREAARLEEELALNRLLDERPRPQISSNFTARVLAEIARDETRARPDAGWRSWMRRLHLPRLAAVATVVVAVGIAWWQFQLRQRDLLASNVSELSRLAAVPGVDTLRDYEAIRLLRTSAQPGDVELVAALASE